MQIIKPQALGLCTRTMAYRKRLGLCVSGYLHVPFAQAEHGTVWGEQSMWDFLAREMPAPLIDEGIAKLTSEFLVHGHAYTPPARKDAVAVRARLGSVEKTLLVFGDRWWEGDAATAPQPFESMPLDPSHAYGGPDFPDNPVGKGRTAVDGRRWLPNIESPSSRVLTPRQAASAAGFGPLDPTHSDRAALRGTYDQAWLEAHSPGFAPDLNWKYFNVAPSDQWLPVPLKGDETFALENLHPTRPLIEGRLPGLRVRAFAGHRQSGGDTKLREVGMRLTTVWFFPHAERMVLVFHGIAETAEEDAGDIVQLIGAIEGIDAQHARDDAHYLAAIARRTEGPLAALHTLVDHDLLPEGLDTVDPTRAQIEAGLRPEGLQADAQYRRAQVDVRLSREEVQSRGLDPDALGIRLAPREKPPTPAELPAYIERIGAELERQRWADLEALAGHLENAVAFSRSGKTDPATPQVHRGPPVPQADAQLASIETAHARAGLPFDRHALAEQLSQLDALRQIDYHKSAHLQPPAPPLTGSRGHEARREVEWLLAQGRRKLPRIDLTGADLSNLDLREVDLSGAWLESADLRDSNLSRANLEGAVLAHARLGGAIAIGTRLRDANLGGSDLERAVLDQADLHGAILTRARLIGTELRGAVLTSVEWLDAVWERVDLSGATAGGQLFHKVDLRTCLFVGTRLDACQFLECDLSGADFTGADLGGATLLSCNAQGTRFLRASMARSVFVGSTRLGTANLGGARLDGANFGGCDLAGASLVEATLDHANLASCVLSGIDARRARARGALLRKARLDRARLSGIDLKDAILQHADLRGADLRDAHLFGADLSGIHLDGESRVDGAVLERARIHPRRRRQPAGDAA